MADFGLFHPFTLHKSVDRVRNNVIYKGTVSIFVIRGTATSATQVNTITGAETSINYGVRTWTINDTDFTATLFEPVLTANVPYYFKLTIDGVEYWTDIILNDDCTTPSLVTYNTCNDINVDWESATVSMPLCLPNLQQLPPETETQFETIITAQGEKRNPKKQITRYRHWFTSPKAYSNLLAGVKSNDAILFDNVSVKNFDFSEESIDDFYSAFTISFEYINQQQGNQCCDEIDLDDIANPNGEGTGEGCGTFLAEIVNTSETLSVTLTDEPVGTPSYRWYRNNLQISTASSIAITQHGNYKVEVLIDGCKATATYFKDDVCGAFTIRVYAVGNFVNADMSNIPEDCTPTLSVTLDGVEVATSVPFEVSETGTYFVKATACTCIKSGGVYINYSEETNCDFTASITQSGNTLTSVTDATTPTYLWELETGSGRNSIGTASTQEITLKGIYFLTITEGSCSKEVYLYIEPLATAGTFLRYGGTGTAFTVLGIDLTKITNYAGTIKVTINGVVFSYTAGAPGLNQYTVNGSGQVVVGSSLTNPTIIIELI